MFSRFFSRRDKKLYPADPYGNELWKLASRPRPDADKCFLSAILDFHKERDGREMHAWLASRGYEANIDHDEFAPDGEPSWEIDAERQIPTVYAEVKRSVEELEAKTKFFSGEVVSWTLSPYEP